jgi:cytidylate kinase
MRIAIDGPSGAGKSTIARRIAACYNLMYLDTGAMYRAIGLAALRAGVDVRDAEAVAGFVQQVDMCVRYIDGAQHVFLSDEDVSDQIRTQQVAMAASAVSAVPQVRLKLVQLQRETAGRDGAVLDGRDIGTYVLPDAEFKFFLTADASERARRRVAELQNSGQQADYAQVLSQIQQRDHDDATRAFAPLRQADDAVLIDSTHLNIEQVVQKMRDVIDGAKR